MKRRRRLRRLVPDEDLVRRRAAGEALRALARDYDVAHTTLARYFARPEVKRQLKDAARQLRAEQRQLTVRQLAERRLERELRERAEEQVVRERELERHYRAQFAAWAADRPAGDAEAIRRHDRYRPQLQLRRDLHSGYDKEAEQVVAAGGGTQAVLAKTELPTLEHAARELDPVILAQAFDNDARARAEPQLALTYSPRLRRLLPDTQLLRRRAAREPLRTLADDYQVTHTTLARFFAHPETQQLLRHTRQQLRAERQAHSARRSTRRRPEPKRQQPHRTRSARAPN